MNRRTFVANLAAAYAALPAASLPSAQRSSAEPASALVPELPPPVVPYRSEFFSLSDVRLLDGPFGQQQQKNRAYLLKLDPDRLLSWFRSEAGLEPKAPPYKGWESEAPMLPGHILGFYLSGATFMVQATGDATLLERLRYIVDQLAEVQNANGSGYLLPVPGGKTVFRQIAAGDFQITNAAQNTASQINNLFEPTYTWNKITLGLFEMYRATGYEPAKQVLVRTADWLGKDVLDHLSDDQLERLLFCEHGSIHESMADVYLLTGDKKYLAWARRLCFERMLRPLAEGHGEFIDGYHANATIPVYTGAEHIFHYTGEQYLHTAAANFLDEVMAHRCWVIGGNSAHEHFFPETESEQALHVPAGAESCNSVNMLRLTEALYRTRPMPAMLDYYERVLWNHLLAAHEPERGMVTYYTPMEPGTYRVYSDEFDSMWCCLGTGLELPGKYGQMIYTRAPGQPSLDVNLFLASALTWKERGIVLRQETRFPDEPSTSIVFAEAPSGSFTLRVRHPAWVQAGAMTLRLNGEKLASDSGPGEFATITRTWKRGDRLEVALPMRLTVEPLAHSSRYVAFLYGPIVLSGQLGTEGLTKYDFWQTRNHATTKLLPEGKFPALHGTPEALIAGLKPVAGKPLTFRSTGGVMQPTEVIMVPFFRNHYQRYAIYWRLATSQHEEQA